MSMIPASENEWISPKEAEKSPDPAGKLQKSMEHGSSIPGENFSDFLR
jgi:hypothetical protein